MTTPRPARNRKARTTEAERIMSRIIGQRIKAIRLEKKTTVISVANRLGVNRYTYSRMEEGRSYFTAARIVSLAIILETDPHKLLGWESQDVQ